MGEPSEMALLSRLHWWTVEYGLIGTLEEPKIYGAGLLSSIGESASCMLEEVKKIPYTIDAVNYSYDITKTQPQLFVTLNFQNLIDVLEAFADTMSFRRGGAYGLHKAIDSKNTCTAVYSSGLQVSGTFTAFTGAEHGEPVFVKTTGATALSINNKQLQGHGKDFHKEGFSSPVGRLKGSDKPLEDLSADELKAIGVEIGKEATLEFESGIILSGKVKNIHAESHKAQLITFTNCTVNDKAGNILFDPAWGVYDMAVGESITSVFCGAADKDAFLEVAYRSNTGTHHPQHDYRTLELHKLYQQVRNRRHAGGDLGYLGNVWMMLQRYHYDDWLCALEILELLDHENAEPALAHEIRQFLERKAVNEPEYKKLITDGLYLIKHPVEEKLIV
jgi:phenylalanine-4-hydroxylase